MRRQTGFTLIELLVVVAIIAILAAILFPVFAKAKESAKMASCSSNLKQMGIALHMYAQDYDEILPIGTDAAQWGSNQNPKAAFAAAIYPYVRNQHVFYCPSSKSFKEVNAGSSGAAWAAALHDTDANWAAGNIGYYYFSFLSGAQPFTPRILTESGPIWRNTPVEYTTDPCQLWVMSDPYSPNGNWFPHGYKGGFGGILNVLYLDGHVKISHGRPRDGYR